MVRQLVLGVAMATTLGSPAFALTPPATMQMEIKPNMDLILTDGGIAHVASDGQHLTQIKDGKAVALPPGPCKLKNGLTILIGEGGLVRSIGSTTGGAGAGNVK